MFSATDPEATVALANGLHCGEMHWQHGKRKGEPRVIKVNAKRGVGWGGHLGFAEIHPAFIRAIQRGETPLASVPNCIDGTLLAIAAEESIRTIAPYCDSPWPDKIHTLADAGEHTVVDGCREAFVLTSPHFLRFKLKSIGIPVPRFGKSGR